MKPIYIYTDGACRGNPGAGGWAAILLYGEHEKILCGGEKDTTNNRMELTAAIHALSALKYNKLKGEQRPIYIITDSLYLKNGIEMWLGEWKKNNWRTAQRKSVKNQDLWLKLDQLNSLYQIQWRWVKAHNGCVGNERADQIAKKSIPT